MFVPNGDCFALKLDATPSRLGPEASGSRGLWGATAASAAAQTENEAILPKDEGGKSADQLEAMAQAIAAKVVTKMQFGNCDGFDTTGNLPQGLGACCPAGLFSGNMIFSPTGSGPACGLLDINLVGTCATKKCPKPAGYCQFTSDCSSGQTCDIINNRCTSSTPTNGGGGSCFAKDTTTACLFASPAAESCSPVLMADLAPGDLVLGREGVTTVVANQHKAVDTIAHVLTFHTADGAVSMTPDHGVYIDGALASADNVKVGSRLSTGAVKRISKSEGAIINPVTSDGTIVADGILAASNPFWIASRTVDAPLARAVINAALHAAGDVDSIAAGWQILFGHFVASLTLVALAAKALRASKGSA